MLAGERDNGLITALSFLQIIPECVEVLYGPLYAIGNNHGPRFTADLALRKHLLMEVIHHDFGLEANGVIMAFNEAPEFLPGLVRVELRVVFDGFGELVVARYRRVLG